MQTSFETEELTDRQKEILRLFSNGLRGPEIAKRLYLSPHTITSHRRHIMGAMNTRSTAHSVAEAIRRGIIK